MCVILIGRASRLFVGEAMFGIVDLTTFIIGTIVIVLLPGPNSMYVMTVAARRGTLAGFQGALGIFFGDLTLMLLSVGGVASLIQTTPMLFTLLKYAGAAYLVWLGFGLLRSLFISETEAAHLVEGKGLSESVKGERHPFKVALFVSLLNPKAILFFVSFFIQFVEPGYAEPLLTFTLLGVIVQIISQTYLAAIIFIAVYFKQRLSAGSRLAKVSKAGAGTMFVGYGAKLALASVG